MSQYDRWARDYDERGRGYTSITLGHLLDRLDLTRCRDVLDVGCGTGALPVLLLERQPDLHVVGVDRSLTQGVLIMGMVADPF